MAWEDKCKNINQLVETDSSSRDSIIIHSLWRWAGHVGVHAGSLYDNVNIASQLKEMKIHKNVTLK